MTTAVVFDYGFGNVRSMVRALANLGVDTTLTSDYRPSRAGRGCVRRMYGRTEEGRRRPCDL